MKQTNVKATHCFREASKVADHLAKLATNSQNNSSFDSFQHLPSKSNLLDPGTASSFRDGKSGIVDSREVSEGPLASSTGIDKGSTILSVQFLVYRWVIL